MKPVKIYSDTIEQGALDQFNAAMALPCAIQGALMPDAHKGYSLPIGAVVKTRDEIFPAFVGYDIGCGVACVELEISYENVDLELLKHHILRKVPIGFNGHKNGQDTSMMDFTGTSKKLQDIFSLKGKKQLGTLGGGNHFIEVGKLESSGNIAIVIHSGSRGFGHGVAEYYMQEAASMSAESGWGAVSHADAEDFALRNVDFFKARPEQYVKAYDKFMAKQKTNYMKKQDVEGLHSFDIHSEIGKQYLIDMNFCLQYALINRKTMIDKIVEGIMEQFENAPIKGTFINRNHNHAEVFNSSTAGSYVGEVKEIIHRKGATHAEDGMLGVIPGNMIDGSFIVRGKGSNESMSSSSHGAGRVLSRKKAKATLDLDEFLAASATIVSNHTEKMLDEAPGAYKDIFEVMALQSDLVEVVDRVIPLINIKG